MASEFRRHAQDGLVQRLKGDTVKPRAMAKLVHDITGRGPGLYHERAKNARALTKRLKTRRI